MATKDMKIRLEVGKNTNFASLTHGAYIAAGVISETAAYLSDIDTMIHQDMCTCTDDDCFEHKPHSATSPPESPKPDMVTSPTQPKTNELTESIKDKN